MQDVPQTTMTMDEYVQGEVDDLTADFGELGNGITELVNALETAVTADTLIDIQRKLSARKDQLDRYVQANTEAHGNAVRSADGIDTTNGMPTGWLRYGEKLDVNKMNSVMNYINGEQARLQGIISAANTKIEQKMNELPEPQPTQDVIPPDAPENEVSALRNWYQNAKEEGEYLQVINKLEQELAQATATFLGIPIWGLYTGQDANANAKFILDFLAAPAGVGTLGSGSTVKSWLANKPEELDKFMDDPKDYIMNSEVGKQYTDGLLNQ